MLHVPSDALPPEGHDGARGRDRCGIRAVREDRPGLARRDAGNGPRCDEARTDHSHARRRGPARVAQGRRRARDGRRAVPAGASAHAADGYVAERVTGTWP